jgi:hypothetical protein
MTDAGPDLPARASLTPFARSPEGGYYGQYPILSGMSVATPENVNFALSKLGGPMKPFALFDATVPSLGIPNMPVSSFPLPFSSWKHATA